MDLNPQVPDRNVRPGEAEEELGRMAAGLAEAGAQVIAMPCNTAHGQAGAIREVCAAQGLVFIDMIAATADAAAASGARRIGVLATPGASGFIGRRWRRAGSRRCCWTALTARPSWAWSMGSSAATSARAARAGMRGLARALADAGAKALIAGCTEVPLLLRAEGGRRAADGLGARCWRRRASSRVCSFVVDGVAPRRSARPNEAGEHSIPDHRLRPRRG